MTINANSTVVTIKSQTVVGTAEPIALGVDPSLRCLEVSAEPRGEQLIERADLSAAFGPSLPPVLGSQAWSMTLVTEHYGFDNPLDASSSALAPLWAACGYLRADGLGAVLWDVATSRPLVGAGSAGIVPCTIQVDEVDGNTFTAFDVVGTVEVSADSGARIRLTWTLQGRWAGAPSASSLTAATMTPASVTYAGGTFVDPAPWVNVDATLTTTTTGTVEGLASWGFTAGAELAERPDATAGTDAFAPSYVNRAAAPVLTTVLDAAAEGTMNAWSTALTVTTGPVSVSIPGPGAASVTIVMPNGFAKLPTPQGDTFRQYGIEYGGAVDPATGLTSSIGWN
jgi:hypothetical protein